MDLVFNKNEDFNKNLRDEVRHRLEKIKIGRVVSFIGLGKV